MNAKSGSVTAPPGDSKTHVVARLIAQRHRAPVRRLLVVGCGSGVEAAILSRELRCDVTGIDISDRFDPSAAAAAHLEVGDATAMRFADGSFDFVYSYHALEHMPDYRAALSEIRRVLARGGGYCIGTPNRARLIGYLGSKRANWRQKARWNLADWQARLQGRFRNEFGAHAGFTREELSVELCRVFGNASDISLDYYLAVYARRQSMVRALDRSGLGGYLFPSVYFLGASTEGSST